MRRHNPFPLSTSHFALAALRRSAGQALVEYAIVFPIQLMLTLAVIQIAHIFVAKQVLEYGAFCAARATLSGLSEAEAKVAAVIPISSITGPSGATTLPTVDIPGWGPLERSGAADEKTAVGITTTDQNGTPTVECEIIHKYELRVPIGNFVAYSLGGVFLGLDNFEKIGGAPHIDMRATCTLVQPWTTP